MKEIIQKMRVEAHEIAVERRRSWWNNLTPEQQKAASKGRTTDEDQLIDFKPGVIELDPKFPPTPYAVQMQLMMLGVFASLSDLAERTREELEIAALWAATAMLSASDNDVVISPRPEWLPGRDSAQIVELVRADVEIHGGEDEVQRIFGEEWYTGAVEQLPPVLDLSHEPEWAQKLRAIASILMDICPEDCFEDGVWLLEWLNAGAPMFQPAKVAAHDSLDTSVDEHTSTEIQDGNDSIAREPDVFDKHPGRPERFDRPVDVDSGSTSS